MKQTYKNIISVLTREERRTFFILMGCSLLISVADILSIALLFIIVNLYTPKNVQPVLPLFPSFKLEEHYLLPVVIILVIFLLKSFGGYIVYKLQYRFTGKVSSRVSEKNLLLYMEGTFEDHVNIDSAVMIRKIYLQAIEFANYILSGIQQIVTETILVLLSVIALLLFDAKLLFIVALVLLPAIVVLSYITKKRLTGIRKNIQNISEQTLQYLNESLSGFVESNIYDKNKFFTDRYAVVMTKLNGYIGDMQITQGLPSRFFEAFAVFGLFILVAAGRYGTGALYADVFTLGAFVAAAYKIIPGISRIINLSGMVKTYAYTAEELAAANSKPSIDEKKYATENLERITFSNVSFSYKGHIVFTGFNFTINKGSFVCISGDSGKGKTTLVNLLLGFLKPVKGDILFNDVNIAPAEKKNYWNRIAYVKQEPFILHDSILKNIVLFDEYYDIQKINEVIKAAGLEEFVQEFEEGLHKIISQDGKNISGGQRQRIAIARALYKDADLIILDEPFNELDEHSEMQLLKYFKCLAENGKIIMLITHNSESMQYCDAFINLDEE